MSVLAAPFQSDRVEHVRLRGVAAGRAAERNVHVALLGAQRKRIRLVVRRSRRPVDGRVAESVSRSCPTPSPDLTTQPTGRQPAPQRLAPSGAVGMDMKYALTPGLTLTTTINPDFGQVEADPAVVNLSAFETFFLRAASVLHRRSRQPAVRARLSGVQRALLLAARRDRAPHGTDNLPSGDNIYTDVPVQSTILGAAKLTGRVGKFAIGAMQAVQQEESATGVRRRSSGSGGRSSRSRAIRSAACGGSSRTRSSFGGVFTAAESSARSRSRSFPRTYTRRHRLGLAIQVVLQPRPAICVGEQRPRHRPKRSRSAAGEQPALLPAS